MDWECDVKLLGFHPVPGARIIRYAVLTYPIVPMVEQISVFPSRPSVTRTSLDP